MWTIVAFLSLFVSFLFLSALVILVTSVGIDQYRMRAATKTLPIDEQVLKEVKPILSIRRNQIGLAIGLSLVVISFGWTWHCFTNADLVS